MSKKVVQYQQLHPDALLTGDCSAGDQIRLERGPVVGDRVIDVDAEWRTFSDDKGSTGDELSTPVGPSGGDASSSGGTGNANEGTACSTNRSLLGAYKEIGRMAGLINLPTNVVDRANSTFKRLHDGKVLKGRSNDVIASASLYVACRQEGVPRTFKEICAVSKVSKKKMTRGFKQVLKSLETSVDHLTTGDFISRFCCNLGLTDIVQMAATHVAEKAVEHDIVSGRSPLSVAGAVILIASQACEQKRSEKEVSDVVGISESTIKLVYKSIVANATLLFPEDFNFVSPASELPTS